LRESFPVFCAFYENMGLVILWKVIEILNEDL